MDGMCGVTPAVMVHGGAWAIPQEVTEATLAGVRRAASQGYGVLTGGGSALDAVEAAVRVLEDDPVFDAGTGSVLTSDGKIEMDAMIMEGETLRAGSVACVQNIAHPVSLARMVMEKSEHTMIVGQGANMFASEQGVTEVPPEQLLTEAARAELEYRNKYRTTVQELFHSGDHIVKDASGHDTVGAVAVDCKGNVACATSTGGVSAKHPGRVGDSPLIGCGGYADNRAGAVSTTGHGEAITRVCLANNVTNLLKQGHSVEKAAVLTLKEMTEVTGGSGGCIVVTNKSEMAQHFTTKRMAWASVKNKQLHSGIDHGQQFSDVWKDQ